MQVLMPSSGCRVMVASDGVWDAFDTNGRVLRMVRSASAEVRPLPPVAIITCPESAEHWPVQSLHLQHHMSCSFEQIKLCLLGHCAAAALRCCCCSCSDVLLVSRIGCSVLSTLGALICLRLTAGASHCL